MSAADFANLFNSVLLIIIVILVVVTCILMIRNEQVFRYRMRVIDYIHEQNLSDIEAKPFEALTGFFHRYELFGQVNYNAMMIRFWKSPASFFPDEIRPPERKINKLRVIK